MPDPAPADPNLSDPNNPPADPPNDPPADPPPADPTGNVIPFYQNLPEDWRTQAVDALELEGEDKEKRLNQLNRVTDFKSLTKNYFEAQDKIRAGNVSTGLPENPSAEELAEYREANGIPEAPDKYELALEEGLVLGEDDNRILEGVFEVAHGLNIPAEAMSQLTTAMLKGREAEHQAIEQQDGIDKQTATRQLRESWGNDYATNINVVQGFVNTLPESVREDFMSARLANGQALFNSPEVAVWMADAARKLNPAATVVPNSNNPAQAVDDEIKALEDRMGTPEWYKDTAAQERYRSLVDAKSNMGK
jgi:hypothetical protein